MEILATKICIYLFDRKINNVVFTPNKNNCEINNLNMIGLLKDCIFIFHTHSQFFQHMFCFGREGSVYSSVVW